MGNDSLKTAYDLLDLLEYSLSARDKNNGRGLPVGGIREIVTQIKDIVGRNGGFQVLAENQKIIPNGDFSEHISDSDEKSMSLASRSRSEGIRTRKANNLELDRADHADLESESVALERMSYMNIPKVRTVPPDARGKIRELVGIDADEIS